MPNVGIGTTVPAYKFSTDVGAAPYLIVGGTTAGIGTASSGWLTRIGYGEISTYGSDTNIAATGDPGTSEAIAFRTRDASLGEGERMRIASGGNVGIGTSNPDSTLEVAGVISAYNSGVATDILLEASHYSNNAANSGVVQFLRARGTKASPTHPLSGDQLGGIRHQNSVAPVSWPGIYFHASENHSNTAQGSEIRFQTTTNGTVGGNERMVIASSGNVGIGTVSPSQSLHVVGNMKASGQMATGSQTITSGATSTIDWDNGNAISTNYNCASSLTMDSLQDGGTYTLSVTDTGTTQCSFVTTTTGTDAATVTYRFKPANAARTASSHTIYTLMRIGTVVYVSWTSGF